MSQLRRSLNVERRSQLKSNWNDIRKHSLLNDEAICIPYPEKNSTREFGSHEFSCALCSTFKLQTFGPRLIFISIFPDTLRMLSRYRNRIFTYEESERWVRKLCQLINFLNSFLRICAGIWSVGNLATNNVGSKVGPRVRRMHRGNNQVTGGTWRDKPPRFDYSNLKGW